MSESLEDLLQRVAVGENQAFSLLYDATAAQVYGLCLHILRNQAQAEEVAQEAFVTVWKTAVSFDPEKGSAKTWILRIAKNRAIDTLRSQLARLNREQRETALNHLLHFSDVETQALGAIEGEQVRKALEQVDEPHRTALLYCYFGGLSHSELAETTGVALGTAKTRVRTGLKKLKTLLAERSSHDRT